MSAAVKDIEIYLNEDLLKSFRFKKADGTGHDLTGTSIRIQIRRSEDSSEIILDLSNANGRIAFADQTAADTKGVWSISVQNTSLRGLPVGDFVYDVLWISGTNERRVMAGSAKFFRGTTR